MGLLFLMIVHFSKLQIWKRRQLHRQGHHDDPKTANYPSHHHHSRSIFKSRSSTRRWKALANHFRPLLNRSQRKALLRKWLQHLSLKFSKLLKNRKRHHAKNWNKLKWDGSLSNAQAATKSTSYHCSICRESLNRIVATTVPQQWAKRQALLQVTT
jgi:hypothetical protein